MSITLFDFRPDSRLDDWYVVNDGVMGGLSRGHIDLSEEGHAVFYGQVSLANNGGFSMVKGRLETTRVSAFSKIRIRLKGDGKRYQFRLKTRISDRHSYVHYFETSGEWQTIELPLSEFYPVFRGQKLAMADYPGDELEEIGILIGNKKAESFKLEINWIGLE